MNITKKWLAALDEMRHVPGAVMHWTIVRLDSLTEVNREQGPEAGDAMLWETEAELEECAARAAGCVYRLSGSRFVVLSPLPLDLSEWDGPPASVAYSAREDCAFGSGRIDLTALV